MVIMVIRFPRLLEDYQANYATWLSSLARLSMQARSIWSYHGYQVILDCWKVIRPM